MPLPRRWISAALAYFLLAIGIYRLIAGARCLEARSLIGAVQAQRVRWMLNMAERENRMLDAILLGSLGQGNAFFASTSAIAVGGLAATMGSSEKVQAILGPAALRGAGLALRLGGQAAADHGHPRLRVLQVRVGVPLVALRIDHDRGDAGGRHRHSEECAHHAERTARLIGLAGEHSNSGIRSFYHAIAALAWFFHPLLFMVATTWVILILARRDFFSRSLRLIAGTGRALAARGAAPLVDDGTADNW